MTTTPTMPELPEPRTLSRGDEDGPIQLGYTADQMRAYALATLQSQPAEVSDAEIDALMPEPDGSAEHNRVKVDLGDGITGTEYDEVDAWSAPLVRQTVRAILALRPKSVPMTREQAMAIAQSNPDTMTAIRMTEAHHGITAPAGGEGK